MIKGAESFTAETNLEAGTTDVTLSRDAFMQEGERADETLIITSGSPDVILSDDTQETSDAADLVVFLIQCAMKTAIERNPTEKDPDTLSEKAGRELKKVVNMLKEALAAAAIL